MPITHVDVKLPLNFSPFCKFAPLSDAILQAKDLDSTIFNVPSDDDEPSDADNVPEDALTVDQLDLDADGGITVPDDSLVPSPFQLGPTPKLNKNVIPFGATPARYPMGNCNNMHRRPDGTFGLNPDRTLYMNPLVSYIF